MGGERDRRGYETADSSVVLRERGVEEKMHKLLPILVVGIIVFVFVILAVQLGYCGFFGDPESPRYYAMCVADD